jgi:hypothetical protein
VREDTEMTDTIATDVEAIGTLEHLNPHTLVVDTNGREEADADLLASTTEQCVLIPIAAVRTARTDPGAGRTAPRPGSGDDGTPRLQ